MLQFVTSELWLPNSPNLNPVDHHICGWMLEYMYGRMPVSPTSQWVAITVFHRCHQSSWWPVTSTAVCIHKGKIPSLRLLTVSFFISADTSGSFQSHLSQSFSGVPYTFVKGRPDNFSAVNIFLGSGMVW